MDPIQHDACRIARHYAGAFDRGVAERNRKLRDWEPMTQRYRRVFEVFREELAIHDFMVDAYTGVDELHIRSPEAQGAQGEEARILYSLPTVTIWLGNNIVWASKQEGRRFPNFLGEGGCSLSITQQLDASAVVTVLPYRPQVGNRDVEKEVLMLGVYPDPAAIDERKALHHVEVLLAYALKSSLHGAPTNSMHWTLKRAELRHWWLTKFQASMARQWLSRTLPAAIKAVGAVAKAAPAAAV